jgi:hypothetical protein
MKWARRVCVADDGGMTGTGQPAGETSSSLARGVGPKVHDQGQAIGRAEPDSALIPRTTTNVTPLFAPVASMPAKPGSSFFLRPISCTEHVEVDGE